jgi:hypothetical protein
VLIEQPDAHVRSVLPRLFREDRRGHDRRDVCLMDVEASTAEPLESGATDLRRGPVPLRLQDDLPTVRSERDDIRAEIAGAAHDLNTRASVPNAQERQSVLEFFWRHSVVSPYFPRSSDLDFPHLPHRDLVTPVVSDEYDEDQRSGEYNEYQHRHIRAPFGCRVW